MWDAVKSPPSDVFKAVYPSGVTGDNNKPKGNLAEHSKIPVRGVKGDLPVTLSPDGCPVPGDDIVGVLNPGVGITVYPKGSASLAKLSVEHDRLLDLRWDVAPDSQERFCAQIFVNSSNKPGSLAAIASVIANQFGNIRNLNMTALDENLCDFLIEVEVKNLTHLTKIVDELNANSVTNKVERVVK